MENIIQLTCVLKRNCTHPCHAKRFVLFCVVQFLILATDGVWDVTEIGQAVQIVQVRQHRSNVGYRYAMGSTSAYMQADCFYFLHVCRWLCR